MISIDPIKVLVVAVVAVVVLGPERLPAAARKVSALWKDLERLRSGLHEQVRTNVEGTGLAEHLADAQELVQRARQLDARQLLDRLGNQGLGSVAPQGEAADVRAERPREETEPGAGAAAGTDRSAAGVP